MMTRRHWMLSVALCALPMLSACGGGGGGGGVTSTPPPPPAPPPPPPPVGSSTVTRFGITTDATFPAVGDAFEFRWSAANSAYTLVTEFGSTPLKFGDSTANSENHYPASSLYGVSLRKDLTYQYTNLAVTFENGWGYQNGAFAYGIPTAANDVPVTGTATYSAKITGGTEPKLGIWDYYIGGDVKLAFDFGAGSLSGYFDPTITDGAKSAALGRYNFTDTVFGVGSRTFSGKLQHATVSGSGSFNGLFTGPKAAELMAQWNAPFVNPWTNQPGTITGVWIGKKDQ